MPKRRRKHSSRKPPTEHKAPMTAEEWLQDDTPLCPHCGRPGQLTEGLCPFRVEIHGDETPCLCCPHCRAECAGDI